MRHVRSWPSCTQNIDVAVSVNISLAMKRRYHFDSSAHVFARSCASVFAVTTPRVSSCVAIAQIMIHDTIAELCVTMKSRA